MTAAPSQQPQPAATTRSNSLGLSPAELTALLDRLDADAGAATPRRQSRRLEYRRPAVPIVIRTDMGARAAVSVATRNLSRGGLSFLHSAYMHVKTAVVAILKHPVKGDVPIPGAVVRCRHIERHIHEVGVRFIKPIDVRDFLDIDLIGAQYSLEVADPSLIRGKLLLVADDQFDRALLKHYLEPTNVHIVVADSSVDAVRSALAGEPDVVLTDYDLGSCTAVELVNELRTGGMRAPVIVMSADLSTNTRKRVRDARIDAFLPKPIPKDLLYSALAEFFLLGGEGVTTPALIVTGLPEDSPLRALAEKFSAEIISTTPRLEALLAAKDAAEFVRTATRLSATAMALEFRPIAKLAEAAVHAINASGSLDESAEAATAFISACKRVRKAA